MGTKVNHLAHAMKLRARAEECRRLAELVNDDPFASSYLGLAQSYELLAHTEEELAERAPERSV
jgi:hypothetical protein